MPSLNAKLERRTWLRFSLHVFLALLAATSILGCWEPKTPLTTPIQVAKQMDNEEVWNEESRQELRESLRTHILGELRLAKRGHDDILQACDDIYIVDVPEQEQDEFKQFATKELETATLKLQAEHKSWPALTDNDRLDRVEKSLRDVGIILWQASPCCDTCTLGEFQDRIDLLDTRDPGLDDCVRGYAFFIDQNMADELAENTEISVYLAYGWLSPDRSEVTPELYEQNALSIAREVIEQFRKEGFEPNWNGSFSKKIGISLNWRRRTLLE